MKKTGLAKYHIKMWQFSNEHQCKQYNKKLQRRDNERTIEQMNK